MPADLDALLTHVYVLVDDLRADGSAVVPFGSQTASGMPIGFELAPANAPERVVAAELLERHGGRTLAGFVSRVARRLPARRRDPAQLVDRRARTEPRRLRPLRNQLV
jgi:hypothetical protein